MLDKPLSIHTFKAKVKHPFITDYNIIGNPATFIFHLLDIPINKG